MKLFEKDPLTGEYIENSTVTTDDIIFSGSGDTLSEKIASHQADIDSLKSNLKWIYKYGGVGSGGGGGGGGPVQSFSIFALLGQHTLKDQTIPLDGINNYPLTISINNPNGVPFKVIYSYTTINAEGSLKTIEYSATLNIDNLYTLKTNIFLNNNGVLLITASDGNQTKSVACTYVTTPYQFNLSLVNNNDLLLGKEIFVSNAKASGIKVRLNYSIAIKAEVSYLYKFLDSEFIGSITEQNDKTGYIDFEIPSELFTNENAGYYSADLTINVLPENLLPISSDYNIAFNLIPNLLYALILPVTGKIYTKPTENPLKYASGYINFKFKIYEGSSENRNYDVTVNVISEQNNINNEVFSKTVMEREERNLSIFANAAGEYKLHIKLTRAGISPIFYDFYFYLNEDTLELDYFVKLSADSKIVKDDSWEQNNYYKITEASENFQAFKGNIISQTTLTPEIIITGIDHSDIETNFGINTHLAIGLQYSDINEDNATILECFSSSSGSDTSVLTLKANSITIGLNSKEIYIKKLENFNSNRPEWFNLILVYSQFAKQIGTEYYYTVSIYINGVLEAELQTLSNAYLKINKIKLAKVNCFYNLLEVNYRKSNILDSIKDIDAYNYYLAYKRKIQNIEISEDEIKLRPALMSMRPELSGRVVTDLNSIQTVASYSDVPTMLLTHEVTKSNFTIDDFLLELEGIFAEDAEYSFPVSVKWCPGMTKKLEEIKIPDTFKAQYEASLQGSSTKTYRVKNFDLTLKETDEASSVNYYYSPNFSNTDPTTFLPEKTFTLKADVVDSSHSNNTSCGRFVNTVTSKFNTKDSGYYNSYIKNCLDGFPFLLFLEVTRKNPTSGANEYIYLYLGIYNFNLGRSSYFNLGYKNLSVFGDGNQLVDAGDGFTFFSAPKDLDGLKLQLGVAEIQGGSPYFDFSLYDTSILFSLDSADKTYMFGDLVTGSEASTLQSEIKKLVKNVSKAGGYLFDAMRKNFGKPEEGYSKTVNGVPCNLVPDYRKQYKRTIGNGGASQYAELSSEADANITDLLKTIIYDVESEIQPNIDFLSLVEYYTICMVLGLVDSVLKNLNIKTWSLKQPQDTSENLTMWYLAFYDMDTCLGLDNAGNPTTSYFAYSDYWEGNTSTIDDIDYPLNVTIYRDFAPSSFHGYDIPSSYLFAIAKYAKVFTLLDLLTYPQELYAKWRSNLFTAEEGGGFLKDALHFMDTFYTVGLKKICPALISYNYRSKYCQIKDESLYEYESNNYIKFNGTCANRVYEWIKGRLHILDAYFNLGVTSTFSYCDENYNWLPLMIGETTKIDAEPSIKSSLINNPDIIIKRNIFAQEKNLQLSGNINFRVKCPSYTPLQIYNANDTVKFNYILGGERWLNVNAELTGIQTLLIGGSSEWRELSDINWLNLNSDLTITSDKLMTIYGSLGNLGNIILNTPNVKNITLTSNKYTGTIQLNNDANYYSNLKSVNISGSKLSLEARSLKSTELQATNIINNTAEIYISDCAQLTSFLFNNNILLKFTFTNIPESISKNFSLIGNEIKNITLSTKVPGSKCTITDKAVTTISITGFEEVTISNCPNLKLILISEYAENNCYLKKLSVSDCQNLEFRINRESALEQVVDLNNDIIKSENLEVYFANCIAIKTIILPKSAKLKSGACSGLINLEHIDGTDLTINGNKVFCNCPKFTFRTSTGDRCDIKVPSTLTNLSELFYCKDYSSALTREDVKYFIEYAIPENNAITDVSYMFANNIQVSYNGNNFLQDLNSGTTHYIKLNKFNKVTNASGMFYHCNITALNKEMLRGLGSENGVNLNLFWNASGKDDLAVSTFGASSTMIFTTLDALSTIITKVTAIGGDETNRRPLFFLTKNSINQWVINKEETINLRLYFNPIVSSSTLRPAKLTTLSNIILNSHQTFDLSSVFTEHWANLHTISCFIWQSDVKYTNINKLFYNLPKLRNLSSVLLPSVLTVEEATADLYTILNWDVFLNNIKNSNNASNSFANCFSDSYATGSFTFRKKITTTDYKNLCKKILKSTLDNISYLFSNCIIENFNDAEFTFFDNEGISNSQIKYLRGLYKNCKLTSGGAERSIPLSLHIFKSFTKITDVQYLFENCLFSKCIPFNLFNKRKRDNTIVSGFVKDENENMIEATVYIYTYDRDIINFQRMFYGCKWDSTARYYTPPTSIDVNHVTWVDNGVEKVTYTYYPTEDSIEAISVPVNPEKLDAELDDFPAADTFDIGQTGTQKYYSNPTIVQGSANKCIIPPDLFYGAADSAYFNNALACNALSCLIGLIPKNIFRIYGTNLIHTGSVNNLFANQIVIPQYIGTVDDKNIYSCYPRNYTGNTSLSSAFNSRLYMLPCKEYCTFVILLDSIPKNTISLQSAFDGDWGSFNGNLWTSGLTVSNEFYFNFIGNVTLDNIFYGFNLSYFTQLKLDNIFNSEYLYFVFGDLLYLDANGAIDHTKSLRNNNNNYIIQFVTTVTDGLSKNIKFPNIKGVISNFLDKGGIVKKIQSTQLSNSENKLFYIDMGFTFIE